MKGTGNIVIFLTLIPNILMLDLSKFWVTNQTPLVMESARPIEIVRWRQPVCLMPAQGVSPCYLRLRKFQNEYDSISGQRVYEEASGHLQEAILRSSVSSQDGEDSSFKFAADVPSASLQSSEGSEEAAIGRSQLTTPELTMQKENVEERRYLGIRGEATPNPQQIYVTKVINAPMTATLVAHNCLPDIGIPLCQDYQPIQPSKPVFDSQPTISQAETGNPTIIHRPSNCQNSVNHVFHDNQNVATTVNHGLYDLVAKPIPTRTPIQRPVSSLGPAVCHSCVKSAVTSEKLEHIVISMKPVGEVVEQRPQTVATGSPFYYYDTASQQLPQQMKTEFDIQLSRNSGSETEGQESQERPQTIVSGSPSHYPNAASQKLDHRTKTKFDIQLSGHTGSEIEDQGAEEESLGGKRNKNSIFQTIHDIVNRTENLPIVQKLQNLLHGSGHQDSEESSDGSGILGNIFRPINLFNRKKGSSTTPRPESSTQIVKNSSVSSSSHSEESTKASGIEIMEKPAIMDVPHKPENNISNGTGLLDIFESVRDHVDAESVAKPTEKPGLLGDLFANPVGPIEAENGKVEAKGN